jgi:hypothetical protein
MSKAKPRKKAPGRARRKSVIAVDSAKVFAELAFAVAQGADEGIKADGRPYVFSPAAREFWLNGHAKSIPTALLSNDWLLVREVVTKIASNMGRFAIEFALPDNVGRAVVVIKLDHARRAKDKVQKTEARCRAALGAGEGMFCAF